MYHAKIGEESMLLLDQGPLQSERMKMTRKTFRHEAKMSWSRPWNSPYGNSNYNRDNSLRRPEKKDYITDPSRKISF